MAEAVTITKSEPAAAAAGSATLLAFADAAGEPRAWRLISGGAIVGRGDELAELPEQKSWVRTVLAVPGTDVTMHWLELGEGLTDVQAAAAARLRLADETLGPISDMHVAAGRRENGLTAIATVPSARMETWLGHARAAAMEPDIIIPEPMLLMPPGEGLVRFSRPDGAPDHRGTGWAFTLEDELAAVVIGDASVRDVGDDVREAGLAPMLADPPINLRQGPFARRREAVLDTRRINWLIALGLILLVLSLALQVTTVVRTTFAADRIEAEAAELRGLIGAGANRRQARAGFAATASALFDALREAPTAAVTQLTYQSDGSLRASILADNQAAIDGIRARIEGRGMGASAGPSTAAGARTVGELTVRQR